MAKQQTSFDEATLSVGADGALAAITAAGANAEQLIEQWVNKPNAAAVLTIAEQGAGVARKAARRGLNVLKSRRVPLEQSSNKVQLIKAETKLPEAVLLPPDATGVRLLAFSQGRADGSCFACLAYVRDGQGILRLENSETTPARLKAALAQVLPGVGYEPVSVPLDWARAKLATAREAHRQRGLIEPLGFKSAQALLEPLPEQSPEHPFDAEGFEFADEDAADLAKDSGSLHHVPEFRSWLPTQAAVQELLANVGKRLPQGQTPDHDAATEWIREEMLAATDRYFSAERCADLIEWMKDAGISILAREGETLALKLAATIQVIRTASAAGTPAREVPFLRAFFEKAISLMTAQSGGRLDIPLPRAESPAA
jgi:hypothetical protein